MDLLTIDLSILTSTKDRSRTCRDPCRLHSSNSTVRLLSSSEDLLLTSLRLTTTLLTQDPKHLLLNDLPRLRTVALLAPLLQASFLPTTT
ncbi:hypothetical protein L596_010205 [Steinernema carpocapsae]|uniref:Uncharacterized protein n=1 Tax=Steinernema carpocapsae TaxID=34508 RepID=A0A4U5PI41_STECR|nr:hypothetical protein L596_010205 [Steinernema carpocapsae]